VRPSIVQIQTNLGLGSGVVFNDSGDVVTNNHVVSGASTIEVTTAEGKTQAASLVGTFAAGDLAVIHVGGHLDPAAFARIASLAQAIHPRNVVVTAAYGSLVTGLSPAVGRF
jgi:putative serine protease PepD